MVDLACRECHRVSEKNICPICGSNTMSKDWAGYVIIIDPKNSEIAKKLKIELPGKYALKVR
ncbi:MAG: transcription elongation factor subunit Spt4 [Candidatus Syntropharchaeia archaeon]